MFVVSDDRRRTHGPPQFLAVLTQRRTASVLPSPLGNAIAHNHNRNTHDFISRYLKNQEVEGCRSSALAFIHQAQAFHQQASGGTRDGIPFRRRVEINLKRAVLPANHLIYRWLANEIVQARILALPRREIEVAGTVPTPNSQRA